MPMLQEKHAMWPAGKRAAWTALEEHRKELRGVHLRDLFRNDPGRGRRMTAGAVGVFLDYSKNRIGDETLKLLLELAKAARPTRTHRRHVPGREDQHHRKPGCPARRPSRA